MIKTELTFLFSFIFLICNSQISGVIYNELNLPVENVSVFCIKNKDTINITLSNKDGFFAFNTISEKETELLISHIGYETLITKPAKEETYFITSKEHYIDEVSITFQKKEKKNTAKRLFGFIFNDVINMAFEDELATFISPTDENIGKRIKNLKYQLADMRKLGVKNNKYQPFKACIYTVDPFTKKPKEKFFRSVKVAMTKNEKWFYVNIDSLDIRMPEEGLFIVLEALAGEEYGYQFVAARGGMSIWATPSIRTKVYNPNKPNKSYIKRNTSNNKRDWQVDEDYYFCMDFEFED